MGRIGVCVLVAMLSGCELYFEGGGDESRDAPAGEPTAGDGQCVEACQVVTQCSEVEPAACLERCRASALLEDRGEPIRCLALRVFWIDEEGCPSIERAYLDFDPADDCSD